MFIKNRVTKIPRELWRTTILLVTVGGIATVISDLFSFLIQAGKDAISAGNVVFGLLCILLYYLQDTVILSVSLWTKSLKNHQEEQCEVMINSRAAESLGIVRDKVFIGNQMMSSGRVLSSMKKYLKDVWKLHFSFPSDLINIISTIILFIGFIAVTTVEIENLWLFITVIGVISCATIYFSYRVGTYHQRYMKKRRN